MSVSYTLQQIFQPGFRSLNGEGINRAIAEPQWSQAAGFAALAGGGQAGATQLYGTIAEVGTVASAGDSVMLPASGTGKPIIVVNGTATSMQVFGQGSDTINGVAFGTGVAQAAGKSALYISPASGIWFRLLSA